MSPESLILGITIARQRRGGQKLMLTVLSVVLALALVQSLRADDVKAKSTNPTIAELEQRVVAGCRDQMRSGKIELLLESPLARETTERKSIIWFADDKYRLDRSGRKVRGPWGPASKHIVADGWFIEDPQRDVLVNMIQQDAKAVEETRERLGLYDPRYLGFVPGGVSFLAKYGPGMILGRTDLTLSTIAPEKLAGVETWRVTSTTLDGLTLTCWIAPSMDYRPVQLRGMRQAKGHIHEFNVHSVLKQYEAKGVWYPARVDSTQSTDGKIVDQDVVTVVSAEFNGDLDRSVFTVAGLDLDNGRRVVETLGDKDELKMWNGKTLVPARPAK